MLLIFPQVHHHPSLTIHLRLSGLLPTLGYPWWARDAPRHSKQRHQGPQDPVQGLMGRHFRPWWTQERFLVERFFFFNLP